MAITTITPIMKRQRTLGYTVDSSIVTYNRITIAWQCSTCDRGACEHIQAVIGQIKAEREERQRHDVEISKLYEQDRALREAEVERQRREAAPLNGNRGFSLMK